MMVDCMRNGLSFSECAMAGSAVLRMLPSKVCMNSAVATIHGTRCVLTGGGAGRARGLGRRGVIFTLKPDEEG